MARYYRVKIGSIYLTHDGTNTGRPCKVDVEGVNGLILPDTGNVATGADGTPFREIPLTPTGAGRPFVIIAAFLVSSVYASLKAALDSAAGSNADFNVTGSGLPGDFDADAIVFDNPQYLTFEGFSGDNLKGVRISLMTTVIN